MSSIWEVTLSDSSEKYAPPEKNLLNIALIGDDYVLEIVKITEETNERRVEKPVGTIAVKRHSLESALIMLVAEKYSGGLTPLMSQMGKGGGGK